MRRIFNVCCLSLLCMLAALTPARGEEVLRVLSSLPRGVDYTERLFHFIEMVNADGEGVIRLQFIGGPEVIPHTEQGDAIRRGAIDFQYGPASFYSGMVAEADALVGSTKNAIETRKNGGLDLLRQIWAEKLNAHILGHFDSGMGFYIFLKKPPRVTDRGMIDLSGVKLRSQPIYREFFVMLGATPLSIPAADAYTAFERGVADGTGWPLVGLEDLGWDEVLNYRIRPSFFQTDLLGVINLDRWNELPAEAQAVLTQAAERYERQSYDYFQNQLPLIEERLAAQGMKTVTLEGEALQRYLAMAYAVPWQRLAERDRRYLAPLMEKFYDGPALEGLP